MCVRTRCCRVIWLIAIGLLPVVRPMEVSDHTEGIPGNGTTARVLPPWWPFMLMLSAATDGYEAYEPKVATESTPPQRAVRFDDGDASSEATEDKPLGGRKLRNLERARAWTDTSTSPAYACDAGRWVRTRDRAGHGHARPRGRRCDG